MRNEEHKTRHLSLIMRHPSPILAMLIFLAVFGLSAPGSSEIVDRIVVVVNGEPVTLSMVEDVMSAIWFDPADRPESRQEALQRLIDHKLMLQEARGLGADVIVSEERLSDELEKVVLRFASPEAAFKELEQQGITREDLQENLIEKIMVEEMVNRKFRHFAEVTDIEASEFYEQHREDFVTPEMVHLDRVFFQIAPDADEAAKEAVRRKAEDAFRKLRNGASFSVYNDQARDREYTPVDRLIPVVAAAVSRLKAGEMSDLIETPAGYFIVKLNDRRLPQQRDFSDVKDEIKELLRTRKAEAELNDWLKRQRELADIRLKVETF